jgi:hypothetical protein
VHQLFKTVAEPKKDDKPKPKELLAVLFGLDENETKGARSRNNTIQNQTLFKSGRNTILFKLFNGKYGNFDSKGLEFIIKHCNVNDTYIDAVSRNSKDVHLKKLKGENSDFYENLFKAIKAFVMSINLAQGEK